MPIRSIGYAVLVGATAIVVAGSAATAMFVARKADSHTASKKETFMDRLQDQRSSWIG